VANLTKQERKMKQKRKPHQDDISQLSSIESQLDSANTRLFTLQTQLDEIIGFLAELKKIVGELHLSELTPDRDDKKSTRYFTTKMTQEEFDEFRKTGETKPHFFNLIQKKEEDGG
jgi:hypothetical protein